jgi:hypothetical protein
MSWITQAFTTVNNDPAAYFATISPAEFYEWRFMKAVPKGARLHRKMPRSDAFTENKVIVSAKIPDVTLPEKGGVCQVEANTPASVTLTVGQLLSPVEVIGKFAQLQEHFERSLKNFRQSTETQKYFTSVSEDSQLYRVASATDKEVKLQLFGTVQNIKEKLAEAFDVLGDLATQRKWRAHEMERYRKFENYMMVLENSAVPIDGSKMEFLMTTAQIKPIQNRTIPWSQCFIEVSADAQELRAKLDLFNSMNWVKHTRQHVFPH